MAYKIVIAITEETQNDTTTFENDMTTFETVSYNTLDGIIMSTSISSD